MYRSFVPNMLERSCGFENDSAAPCHPQSPMAFPFACHCAPQWGQAGQTHSNLWYTWNMYKHFKPKIGDGAFASFASQYTGNAFCNTAWPAGVGMNAAVPVMHNAARRPPSVVYANEQRWKEGTVEREQFLYSYLCSFCMLCGGSNHRYTACRFFDGKTVCFVRTADFSVYPMRHDRWIEGATLHDVYSFVCAVMKLEVQQIRLRVGSHSLAMGEYPFATRCCDLQILPGVVVCVSNCQSIPQPNVPSFHPYNNKRFQEIANRKQQRHVNGGSGVMDDEALDVSAMARASKAPVSPSAVRHHAGSQIKVVVENVAEEASNNSKCEEGLLDKDERTTAPSPVTPETPETLETDQKTSPDTNPTGVTDTGSNTVSQVRESPDNVLESSLSSADDVLNESSKQQACGSDLGVATVQHIEGSGAEKDSPALSPALPVVTDPTVDDEELRRLRTVHVKFIPVTMPFLAIRKLLWSCGEVWKVRLVRPKTTTNPERMFFVCFVEYATTEDAEKMMKLQGHRLADSFRLAVEYCRHPIRGGYVTDRDANTGKPCTFGLGEKERQAIEQNFFAATNSGRTHADAGDVPRGGAAKGSRRRGGHRQRSHRRSVASASQGEELEGVCTTGQAKDGEPGPYTLQIVVARDFRERPRRDHSLPATAEEVEGDNEPAVTDASEASPEPTTTTTAAPAAAVEMPLRVVTEHTAMSDEKTVCDSLSSAAASFVQDATPNNFYKVVTILEDIRWNSVTVVASLSLVRCEVALFLHPTRYQNSENAAAAAGKALTLAKDFLRLFPSTSTVADGAYLSPFWRSLFTTTPPAKQQPKAPLDEKDGAETPNVGGAPPLYLCYRRVGRFIELLFHIAVLFDDFDEESRRRHEAAALNASARDVFPRPEPLSVSVTACALSVYAHRLLERLRSVLRAPGGGAAGRRWRRRVDGVVARLPREISWCVGRLVAALFPHTPQLAAATLTSQAELKLF